MSPLSRNGTQPTDAEIFAHARKALDESPSIPATVRVHIEDGVAWLTGFVRRLPERREAEGLVRNVAGVQRIVNKLLIVSPPVEEGL